MSYCNVYAGDVHKTTRYIRPACIEAKPEPITVSYIVPVEFIEFDVLRGMKVHFTKTDKIGTLRNQRIADCLYKGTMTITGDNLPHWIRNAPTKAQVNAFLDTLRDAITEKNLKPAFNLPGFSLQEKTDGYTLWYGMKYTEAAMMGHMNGRKRLTQFIRDVYRPAKDQS